MRATQPNKARLTKAQRISQQRAPERQLTRPLKQNPNNLTQHQLRRGQTLRAPKENYAMYIDILAAIFALAIFTPAFIGIRANTNRNWRSL